MFLTTSIMIIPPLSTQEMKEDGITDMYSGGLDWAVRLMSHSRRYLQTLDLFEDLSNKGVRLRPSSFNVLMEELASVSHHHQSRQLKIETKSSSSS